MLTMMDVEVLELCTRTVTRIPTTSPATGLDRMALSLKMSPATFPAEHKAASTEVLLNPSPDLFPPPQPLGPTSSQLEGRAEHVQGADKEVKETQHQWHLQELHANLGKLLGQPGLWRWGMHEYSGQNTRASDYPYFHCPPTWPTWLLLLFLGQLGR